MLYLLDTAHLEDIRYANEFYPLAGVTTNPTLIAKEKTEFLPLVREIRAIIGDEKMLFVQTTATKAEEMAKEARLLADKLGGRFFVKVPIGEEGLKATRLIKEDGIGVCMTAIFTPQQALLAARAGADFVAPYVNRLDNIGADGVNVVAEIVHLFDRFDLPCRVLAASFKNTMQVHAVAMAGAHSATVQLPVLKTALAHPMTDAAVAGFASDWQSVYGQKSVKDLL